MLPAVLGVDLLLGADGSWHVLEVNDSAIGLKGSDGLQPPGEAIFPHDAVEAVAKVLADSGRRGPVIILVPDWYQAALSTTADKVGRHSGAESVASADMAALCNVLESDGVQTLVLSCSGLRMYHGRLRVAGGPYVRSVYTNINLGWRSDAFVETPLVNPPEIRRLCNDKYEARGLINRAVGASASVGSHLVAERVAVEQMLEELASDDHDVVVKPRYGFGSQGVQRFRAKAILQAGGFHWLRGSASERWLCEPWIQPDNVETNGRAFSYDVRVYVVNGKVRSGFARRAALPRDSLERTNPLTWLTTLGPHLSLGIDYASNSSASLTPSIASELVRLSEAVAAAIASDARGD